jgi:tight adherence protein B
MDAVLFLAAAAAGLAGFYAALGLQSSLGSTRRLVRARTIDDRPEPEEVRARRRPRARIFAPLTASAEAMDLELTRAGWPIKVSEYRALRILFTAGFALLGLIAGRAIFEPSWAGTASIVVGGALGFFLLPRYVAIRKERRLQRIEKQLPDVLSNMARSLRAGSGLLQALDYTAGQTDAPLGPELQRAIRDLHLGGDYDVVFGELRRRVGSPDLDIAATAITIQRTVGGNLSEILSTVAGTIRERQQIKSEVQVLTARQKLLGNLVALVPPFVAIAFFLVNPDVFTLALEKTAGQVALGVGLLFEIAGLALIRRLAVIEV